MDSKKNHNISYTYFQLITIILFLALSSCSTTGNNFSLPSNDPETDRSRADKEKQTDLPKTNLPIKAETSLPVLHPSITLFDPATNNATQQIMPEPETDKVKTPLTTVVQAETENPISTNSTEEAAEKEPEPQITYDFPITMNEQVEKYLDRFQQAQRGTFKKWLERSGRYLPMIKEKLKQANLPLDLAYIPLIESGYNLTAYSRSHAAGPWQFIASTAGYYGLKINSYIDERRDPVKATDAAIDHLTELYEEFGDWELAAAAYNGGRYKIIKGLKRYKTDNFWELAKTNYLYNETRDYVPKLIAAILIAKNPKKYGFDDLHYAAPLDFDTIEVAPWTSLHKIAVACETDYREIKELNQELKTPRVPGDSGSREIRIPAGKKDLAYSNLPRVRTVVHTRYKTHIAKRDETLSDVCRRYKLNRTTILKSNNLKSSRLKKGQRLRIPYQTTSYALLDKPPTIEMAAADGFILHRVEPGETLSHLSLKYQVPIHQIAAWNGLSSVNSIRAGDKLALYIAENNPSVPHIDHERPNGQQLALAPHHYQVKKGDSLWEISRRYDISVEEIKALNNLQDNLIHPETQLLLREQEEPGG